MTIPIALQTYSVRHEMERDPAATLKAVAGMGYVAVEFFGEPKPPAGNLRRMLDDAGLTCCGWHTPFSLVQDDKLEQTLAFNRILDNKRIIVPWIPEERRRTREEWIDVARFFNRLAGRLAGEGMATGYHNHHFEFEPLEGELPWYTFFDHTDAGVIMQLDTGNAMAGGGAPVEILERYPGRAGTVHLKPYNASTADRDEGFRPLIGEDSVPWETVFELCETRGSTEWYIVEYESDAYPALEAVDLCLKKLREMGK